MQKEQVISAFGGVLKTAKALGISRQTVWFWPDKLDRQQQDRVIGAAFRMGIDIQQLKNGRKNAKT